MKEIKLDDNGLEKSIPTEYKIESERESDSEINQTESLIVNESDRFAIINKPIDLPRIPTIYLSKRLKAGRWGADESVRDAFRLGDLVFHGDWFTACGSRHVIL
jgi:hypothetical protein